METKNKIFQPKVIIGSITSFIVAAVGIIAVFFPSVFNLEKSSIKEKTMFLHTPESADELFKFLKDNLDEIVKINIIHCSGENFGSSETYGETYFGKPKPNASDVVTAYPFRIYSKRFACGDEAMYECRENGFIEMVQAPNHYEIRPGKMSDDAVYEWHANYLTADDEKINKTCKALEQGVAGLFGTFMVNNESSGGLIIFGLDPVSKKDLKLKKY